MLEWITTTLFTILLTMPFITTVSMLYLARLVRDAVQPPILLVLLTATAVVTLVTSTYLAVLRLRVSFLEIPSPPQLLPVTLTVLIAPMVMVNVIAFMLWRSRGSTGGKGPRGATGPKGKEGAEGEIGDTGAKGKTGAKGPKGDSA